MGRQSTVSREQRFWAKVDVGHPCGCWEWTGGVTGAGYGSFAWRDERRVVNRMAHRYAYELLMGDVEGLPLDHLCRNTLCVNPDHLEPVTMRENTSRGTSPQARFDTRETCNNGHPRTPDNTYVSPQGYRACLPCRRERSRRYNARVSAQCKEGP